MALSFIGKPISLISHSDVRYRGILAGIDPAASTIQLSNVYSMGTESRRPPAEFIPPVQEPYQYIIFRASEVKDLAVDEPTPRRSVHDDPAVLGASTQAPPPVVVPVVPPSYAQQTAQQLPPRQQQQQQVPQQPTMQQQQPRHRAPPPQQQQQQQHQNAIHTAAASLETVERALGDLRVSNAANNNVNNPRRRSKRPMQGMGHDDMNMNNAAAAQRVAVPAADFDFASMNAKFDKAALAARAHPAKHAAAKNGDDSGSDHTNPSDDEDAAKEKEKEGAAYNPQKSFFDSLSSPPPFAPRGQGAQGQGQGQGGGRGGRGRGRGGYGYNRREEERERNVATFGEPGGVGLLGPGAYVGGWGGYGGGGGHGRRGGGRRRGPPQAAAAGAGAGARQT
ncbi:Scd6-like Sm domain-containing protein [Mycena rebaudengoi]|nr:Scd6-like Sm domain-containing protein [Mycena rebaudengoi]